MAVLNFDATQVEPDTGFETIPAGWYNTAIDESELKPTRDGMGSYLQLRFNVLDGQYVGRKLFARLNIRNANAQTVEIALKQLSAIGHAVNVLHIQDSAMLHGIPLKIKVKIRPASGDYEASNDITAYRNINEQVDMAGAAPAGVAQFAPPAMPAGFGAPPVAQPQAFAQPPVQQFAPPPQQFVPQQVPDQQFAQQPQQPQAAPAQQPWAQPPVQQAIPQQQPPQQQPQAQPEAQPAWAQQPQQAAPVAQQPQQQQAAPEQPHPAQAMTPPWAQPQG